jgi:tRNA pseudouridine55 synthase
MNSEPGSHVPPSRRERRALDGVLLIDKPLEMSSAQVVGKVKWLLGCEKVGHAGTLDPGASGLLVCLLGRATRLASHAEGGMKTYSGTVQLGVTTSSDDVTGEVLTKSAVTVGAHDIERVAARFVGDIQQMPPKVSALKVGGKRAYALTRQGIDVELKARPVRVYDLQISNVGETTFDFICSCSKGTYIRSLARDIGAELGCGGALKTLRREASQPFTVTQAIRLDGELSAAILPWSELFPTTRRIELPLREALGVWNGDLRALASVPAPREGEHLVLYSAVGGAPVGLLEWSGSAWRIVVNVSAPGGDNEAIQSKGE